MKRRMWFLPLTCKARLLHSCSDVLRTCNRWWRLSWNQTLRRASTSRASCNCIRPFCGQRERGTSDRENKSKNSAIHRDTYTCARTCVYSCVCISEIPTCEHQISKIHTGKISRYIYSQKIVMTALILISFIYTTITVRSTKLNIKTYKSESRPVCRI